MQIKIDVGGWPRADIGACDEGEPEPLQRHDQAEILGLAGKVSWQGDLNDSRMGKILSETDMAEQLKTRGGCLLRMVTKGEIRGHKFRQDQLKLHSDA